MSSFKCEKCGTDILDTEHGYITSCEHYPNTVDPAPLYRALTRIRDCDWVISLPDRMDAVRDIARAALIESKQKIERKK